VFAGCDSNPTNKLLNPTGSSVTVNTSSWSNPFLIYKSELLTSGDVTFFNSQEGQVLNFFDTSSPVPPALTNIRYSWDGSAVTHFNANGSLGNTDFIWTGFGFAVKNSNLRNPSLTKDITPGHYTHVSFNIKGSLSSNVAFRIEFQQTLGTTFDVYWQSNSGDSKITDSWQTYTFAIPGSQANQLQYYLILSFQNLGSTKSNGGTVYLDNIQLTQ